MVYIGVDLHKKVIVLCVVNKEKSVLARKQLACPDMAAIVEFFRQWQPFEVVIEATASYEWLVRLLEPLAARVVLAHPKKLRIIAESTRKTDRIDAQVLAEQLAKDEVPEAYRPTPRQREHRRLVRQRYYVQGRITSVRCKVRAILSDYNADRSNLFTKAGLEYLATVAVSAADRVVLDQLHEEWRQHRRRLREINAALREFGKQAGPAEVEARAVLDSIPMVGTVTIDVVLSELGDARRFRSVKRASSYGGLTPGIRESGGKARHLGIEKAGSPLLRWALVEAAWRLVGKTRRWGNFYQRLRQRAGPKKAIVAVARKLLCVMVSLLKRGDRYRPVA